MTKQEKLKEASRLRDIIRKRANRLKDYEKATGMKADALEVLKTNSRKYEHFDSDTGHVKSITKELTEEQLDKILKQERDWLDLKTSTVRKARSVNILRNIKTGEMLAEITGDESVKDTDFSDFWNKISELRKGLKEKGKARTFEESQILSDLQSTTKYKEVFEEVSKAVEKGWDSEKLKDALMNKINEETNRRKLEGDDLTKQTGGSLPDDIKGAREATQKRQEAGRLQGNKKNKTKKPKQNKKR